MVRFAVILAALALASCRAETVNPGRIAAACHEVFGNVQPAETNCELRETQRFLEAEQDKLNAKADRLVQ